MIKDVIADAMLQQILTRPDEYSVIATMNLNGDYLSTRWRLRSAASASRLVRTSATRSRCSKRRTAPRRSTPVRTR